MTLKQTLRTISLIIISIVQISALWATDKTIAILPFVFKDKYPEPKEKVEEITQAILEKAGLTLYDDKSISKAWTKKLKFKQPISIPNIDHLIKLGKLLKVNYVCAGVINWEIRNPWVFLGPKMKGICKVHCIIIDINTEKTILDAKSIEADSHQKVKDWKLVGDIKLAPLIVIEDKESERCHMNRAGQLAMIKTLHPFVTYLKSVNNQSSIKTETPVSIKPSQKEPSIEIESSFKKEPIKGD